MSRGDCLLEKEADGLQKRAPKSQRKAHECGLLELTAWRKNLRREIEARISAN